MMALDGNFQTTEHTRQLQAENAALKARVANLEKGLMILQPQMQLLMNMADNEAMARTVRVSDIFIDRLLNDPLFEVQTGVAELTKEDGDA